MTKRVVTNFFNAIWNVDASEASAVRKCPPPNFSHTVGNLDAYQIGITKGTNVDFSVVLDDILFLISVKK